MENNNSTLSSSERQSSSSSSLNDTQNLSVHQHPHLSQLIIPVEDPLLTDVWIGIILVLMVLVCIGYICTCVLYHKFRRWKQQVLQAQRAANRLSLYNEFAYEESLPSYTIVTGLPSYDQAMEQFRQLRVIRRMSSPKLTDTNISDDDPPRITFARLSLGEIFQFYKVDKNVPV